MKNVNRNLTLKAVKGSFDTSCTVPVPERSRGARLSARRIVIANAEHGFTLLELLVVMVIMSIVATLIYFTYSAVVRSWVDYNRKLTSINQAHLCYTAVDKLLTSASRISTADGNRTALYLPSGDTVRVIHEGDSLTAGNKTLVPSGSGVKAFYIEVSNVQSVPVWKCSLTVATNGKSTDFVWRGVCDGNGSNASLSPCATTVKNRDTTLFWESR